MIKIGGFGVKNKMRKWNTCEICKSKTPSLTYHLGIGLCFDCSVSLSEVDRDKRIKILKEIRDVMNDE